MTTTYKAGEQSGLAQYILEEIFAYFEKERGPLELKWQRNLDALNSISSGKFWKKGEADHWRSDTFVPLTKVKIIAAYSFVVDILLAGGEIPFMLKPSPWDYVQFEDMPEQQQELIKDAIEDMTGRIKQQFTDCHADRQMMKAIMSMGVYGETIAKRYVNEITRGMYAQQSLGPPGLQDPTGQYSRFVYQEITKNAPWWEYLSVWDFFRDLETDDLQAGVAVIQRQQLSPYWLRQRLGQPYFIDNAIQRAIREASKPGDAKSHDHGTDTTSLPPGLRDIKHRFNTMRGLEVWGRVPRKIAETFEETLNKKEQNFIVDVEYEYDGDEIEIMALLADDEVVRYARNKPNNRQFSRSVWEDKLDHVEATGVADNLESVQLVLNGMVRAFEDNKKLSANVIAATKRAMMSPSWDGSFTPGIEIEVSDECDDARKAIQQLIIADVGETLLSGIALFQSFADEVSMLPRILQGDIRTKQKPDTAYEISRLQENAGKYLGGVVKNIDEGLIEPMVTAFYKYNMEDPDIQRGKGNFIAEPLGFSSFQDKAIRLMSLMKFMALILSAPELRRKAKVDDLLKEISRASDLDPSQTLKTPEEEQEEATRMQNDPLNLLQVATIKEELDKLRAGNEKTRMEVEEIVEEIKQKWAELEIKAAEAEEKLIAEARKPVQIAAQR